MEANLRISILWIARETHRSNSCKRLRRKELISRNAHPALKLPRLIPSRDCVDSAAIAAKPETTGSSAIATELDQTRRKTARWRGGSGRRCESRRRARCEVGWQRREQE